MPPRPPSRRRTCWAGSLVLRPETKARARALQILYAWELAGRPDVDQLAARLTASYGRVPDPQGERALVLARRAAAGHAEFDRRVADAAEHWRLERIGVIERSLLRLALAELAEGVTPPRVVIDEAMRLAHWFAGPKAPPFVNGVLDAVARQLGVL